MFTSKSRLLLSIIAIIILLHPLSSFAFESDSVLFTNQKYYSISVGYWNDNLLFDKEINNLLNKNILQTDDDFITTSFWLRISKQEKLSHWFLDSYLNIATNRQLNFRMDFLSLLLTYETHSEYGLFRLGGGFISTGNFSGSQIQNFYHRIYSIEKLTLPYSEETYFGLSAHSSIKPIIYHLRNFQLNGITSFSLFTGGGPSSIELGVEGNYTAIEDKLLFNLRLGYRNYLNSNKIFESFFGKEIVWGIFSTIRISSGIQSSFWITGNQYGNGSQNHFGISFSFLTQKLLPIIFEDVSYP
ncbi:MAG: hypothetical protein V3V16_12145 [Melioribacteraceae bacterium]